MNGRQLIYCENRLPTSIIQIHGGKINMKNKSRLIYMEFCKKHNIVPNIKGMKNWSKLMK